MATNNATAVRVSATAQLVVGAALISFSPVFVKLAQVGPTAAGFYRTLFGGMALAAILVFGKRRRLGRRAAALAAVAGMLLAIDLAVWHRSIQLVGPGLATILGNFQVFVLAAFGIVALRERPSIRLVLAVPMAMLGLFLIFGLRWDRLGTDFKLGVLFGGLTAVFYAAFLLVLRAAQRQRDSGSAVTTMALLSFTAAIFLLISVRLEGESLSIPDAGTWAALVAYALVSQVVGWVMIARALPGVDASRAGLILLLQPSLAFIWDVLFFQRATAVTDVVGVALALAAIYLGASGKRGRA